MPGPIIVAAGKGISPETIKRPAGLMFLSAFISGHTKGVAPNAHSTPPLCLREDSAISIALIFQDLQCKSWRGRLSSPASPSAWGTPAFRTFVIERRGSVQPLGVRSHQLGDNGSRRLKSSTDIEWTSQSPSGNAFLLQFLLELYHASRNHVILL